MQHQKWRYPKCDNRHFGTDSITITGSGWSKTFDLQDRKFATVSCTYGGYTEMYKTDSSDTLSNIFDLYTT